MRAKLVVAVVAVAVVGWCTAALLSQPPAPKEEPKAPPVPIVPPVEVKPIDPKAAPLDPARPFRGPVFVRASGGPDPRFDILYCLEKSEVRTLGGRAFVVGTVMKDPPHRLTDNRFAGDTVWVPIDTLREVVELTP